MSRPAHYSPAIDRAIVSALYHEARRRRQPMTRLVNQLLTDALQGTPGWQIAHSSHADSREPPRGDDPRR